MSPTRARIAGVTHAGWAVLAAWVAVATVGAVMCGEPPAGRAEPDPLMQGAIDDAASAIARQEGAAAERIQALQRLASGQRAPLLLQMALYLEKSEGTERSMAGALLLRQLAFTPREIIETVVPHLEGARPSLRRVLTEMLGTIDRREDGEPDFRVYESWLAGRGGPPPGPLVRYLYEASPDEALLCMRHVFAAKASLQPAVEGALDEVKKTLKLRDASRAWSDEERARALAALDTLSRDPSWWVRRYAATILGRDRALGTPALVQRLAEDSDPLVRDALVP